MFNYKAKLVNDTGGELELSFSACSDYSANLYAESQVYCLNVGSASDSPWTLICCDVLSE